MNGQTDHNNTQSTNTISKTCVKQASSTDRVEADTSDLVIRGVAFYCCEAVELGVNIEHFFSALGVAVKLQLGCVFV